MERSERTLVPEWLRSTGTGTGGGNSAHHFAFSSSNSDVSLLHHGRHKNSRKISDFNSPRSSFLDRTYSLNSGRSSSNVAAKHAYSNFSRSNRDKDRERDTERTSFGDHYSSDPLEGILNSRVEKLGGISTSRVRIDTLRRSHSMLYRKQGESLPRGIAVDSRDNGYSNHNITNGLHSEGTIGSSIHKAVFERDFPSLGTEEGQGVTEIARVSSPVLGSASQSVPVGNSALIDGEGWTSALADVPSVVGSSSRGSLPTPQTVSTTSSGVPSVMCGLNMAEVLAQAPSRTCTAPLLSVTIQRREELAIKQSRQLIPVTPSMPKVSVLNAADKSKAKPAARMSEMNIAVNSGSQAQPLINQGNHSPHSGHVKSDVPKISGKLLVLKPGWDNGVSSPTQNDIASPTTIANKRVVTSQHAAAPVNSSPARNSNSPKISAVDRKVAAINPIPGFTVEKRPLTQTQSRNDFFNLLKKKTTTNSSGGFSDSDPQISLSTTEKSEVAKEVICASATAHAGDGTVATSNGDTCSDDSEKNMNATVMVYPDEEEAAFLRSLGWEENNGDDEGLTEEEINAFYQEHLKLRPSLKLGRDMQAKLSESVENNLEGASSELSSSNSSEA